MAMKPDMMTTSIYNPKRKFKEAYIFPKISKVEESPPSNKVFERGVNRKYNQQNIFKAEDDKKQKLKLILQDQHIREIKNRECQQLEAKMEEMIRKHEIQLKQIQEAELGSINQIGKYKKDQYEIKLNMWELKNEIINLNQIYLQQKSELQMLQHQLNLHQTCNDQASVEHKKTFQQENQNSQEQKNELESYKSIEDRGHHLNQSLEQQNYQQ